MGSSLGVGLIFGNVLLTQLGLPLPALPTLLLAGALTAAGRLPAAEVFAASLLAYIIGDATWYAAGRMSGGRVMKLLCRISLTPDICVGQTQRSFERWGAKSLIIAKFVPGLSMIAPPLAGATHMSLTRFAALSTLGSALWVGAALLAGMLLRSQIERLLPRIVDFGSAALLIVLALLAAYVAFKWRERRRFYAALDVARIGVDELYALIQGAAPPTILDVRSTTAQELQLRRIPGALHMPLHEVGQRAGTLPRDREIILYCSCPNEASAAQAAHVLMRQGFRKVRPLHGGLDAWIAAGYAVEDVPGAAVAGATRALAVEATR
ncbi:MAG TPA: DedA family protein/thiosulfate sulfurtransferase GlpE [Steroidobacteraceae bacterium]|jgi:membrane protein DedA with SNARE-associated domain/rhodanese-related sulfurtransferase|nr:DedA family protein/thiosulfate sulfurtransferase GlpE [Steroidobacteraceae bacterium]